MQAEDEERSSTTMMDPWSIFLYGMKAPMTREKYRGRLAKFFDFIGLTEGTMEERAKTFTERGKMLDKLGLGVFNYNNAVRGSDVVRTDRVDHF
jgi:hypothetical protein